MKLSRNPSVKTEKDSSRAYLSALILVMSVLSAAATQEASARESGRQSEAPKILMLVREWEPDSGVLIGWLPLHSVAIQLRLLSQNKAKAHYEPNEAVYVKFPTDGDPSGKNHVEITPAARVFEGESWIPLKRCPNLVHIGKEIYVLRAITFSEGKWRGTPGGSAKSTGPSGNGALPYE